MATKHLFVVLSNITQLVVEAYLNEHPDFMQDAIILYPKRFKPTTNYKSHYFPYIDELFQYNLPGRNFIKKQQQFGEIHNFVSDIIKNNAFVFYVPHFYINTLRTVSLMKQCVDFKYIEEGTLSYMQEKNILVAMPNKKLDFLQSKGMGFSVWSAYPDFNKEGICINEKCFPFLNNKTIIKKESIEKSLIHWKQENNQTFDNSAILVVDSCVENRMCKLDEYILALTGSIAFLKKKGIQKIYFKFHPDQHLFPLIEFYRAFLTTENFDVYLEELPPNTSLEFVFMTSKNLTVVHTISSLGFYAKLNGQSVFSNAGVLLKNVEFKNKYFDAVNADFNFDMMPINA